MIIFKYDLIFGWFKYTKTYSALFLKHYKLSWALSTFCKNLVATIYAEYVGLETAFKGLVFLWSWLI